MTVVAPPIPHREQPRSRQLEVGALPGVVRVAVGSLIAAALLWPLAMLVPDALTAEAWTRHVWSATWLSLWQASLAAVAGVALSIPLGWALARLALPGRSLWRALLTLPIVVPAFGVALGTAWSLDGGLLPLLALVNVGLGLAIGVRLVGGVWAALDPREAESARTLGLNRLQVVRWYYLPALRAPLIAALALAFALAVSAFVPAYLVGSSGTTALPVLAASTAERATSAAPSEAAAAAFVLTFVVVLALVAFVRYRPASQAPAVIAHRLPLGSLAVRDRGWLALAGLLGLAVSVGPLLALLHGTLTIGAAEQVTGANLAAIVNAGSPAGIPAGIELMPALRRSLLLAVLALAVAVPVGAVVTVLVAPLRGWVAVIVEVALFLPFFLPVALAAGLRAADRGPGWLLLVHVGIALPLMVRVALPEARRRLRSGLEVATVLGASRWTSWRWLVEPRLRVQLGLAIVLASVWSIGELGAALLLHRLDLAPGAVAIAFALEQQTVRADGVAFALAALFVLLVTIGFVTIEHRRSPEITEF